MTTKNKKIMVIVAVLVALIISNLIGGIIGFNKGYEAKLYQEGLESISTVMNLNSLHKGIIDCAMHSLEIQLDWQIYNIGAYEPAYYSLYNLQKYSKDVDVKKLQTSIMEKVAAYRREYPCEAKYDFEKDWCSPDNVIRKQINNTLKKYEGQSKTK